MNDGDGATMGIKRIVYHSVECDKCKMTLDNYEKRLSNLRPNRIIATKIADKYGFIKTKTNMWLCPKCAKEYF